MVGDPGLYCLRLRLGALGTRERDEAIGAMDFPYASLCPRIAPSFLGPLGAA
jgi:hypothetical protein